MAYASPGKDPYNGLQRAYYQKVAPPPNVRKTPYPHPGAEQSASAGGIGEIVEPTIQISMAGKRSDPLVQHTREMKPFPPYGDHMYDELTSKLVVFHFNGRTAYGGPPVGGNEGDQLRGPAWINDRFAENEFDEAEMNNVDLITFGKEDAFPPPNRLAELLDGGLPESDYEEYYQRSLQDRAANSVLGVWGRPIPCKSAAMLGKEMQRVARLKKSVPAPNSRIDDPEQDAAFWTENSSAARLFRCGSMLRNWNLDGVIINEEIHQMRMGKLGSNNLIFNIATQGPTPLRNTNVSSFTGGPGRVPGKVGKREALFNVVDQSSLSASSRIGMVPQDFDPHPDVGDTFFVALHAMKGSAGGKIRLEYVLWSARRWQEVARYSLAKNNGSVATPSVPILPASDPSGSDLDPRTTTVRDTELEWFRNILGAWRVGKVVDAKAGVGSPMAHDAASQMQQRCQSVRLDVKIGWLGLVELRSKFGTVCKTAANSDSPGSVMRSLLNSGTLWSADISTALGIGTANARTVQTLPCDVGEAIMYKVETKLALALVWEASIKATLTSASLAKDDFPSSAVLKRAREWFATNGILLWWKLIQTFSDYVVVRQILVQLPKKTPTSTPIENLTDLILTKAAGLPPLMKPVYVRLMVPYCVRLLTTVREYQTLSNFQLLNIDDSMFSKLTELSTSRYFGNVDEFRKKVEDLILMHSDPAMRVLPTINSPYEDLQGTSLSNLSIDWDDEADLPDELANWIDESLVDIPTSIQAAAVGSSGATAQQPDQQQIATATPPQAVRPRGKSPKKGKERAAAPSAASSAQATQGAAGSDPQGKRKCGSGVASSATSATSSAPAPWPMPSASTKVVIHDAADEDFDFVVTTTEADAPAFDSGAGARIPAGSGAGSTRSILDESIDEFQQSTASLPPPAQPQPRPQPSSQSKAKPARVHRKNDQL